VNCAYEKKSTTNCCRRRLSSLKWNQRLVVRRSVRLFVLRVVSRDGSVGTMRRRQLIAAWLTAVVALSTAALPAYDPISSSASSTSAKHDRHVGHVTLTQQQYINRKLDELETRLGRRLSEQAKRLNHSITIHYLEKVRSMTIIATSD